MSVDSLMCITSIEKILRLITLINLENVKTPHFEIWNSENNFTIFHLNPWNWKNLWLWWKAQPFISTIYHIFKHIFINSSMNFTKLRGTKNITWREYFRKERKSPATVWPSLKTSQMSASFGSLNFFCSDDDQVKAFCFGTFKKAPNEFLSTC